MRDVLYVVFSKKKMLLGTFAVIVLATVLFSFLVAPIYETTATVLLKPSIDTNLLAESSGVAIRPNPVTPQDINSEIEIMSSQSLLRDVVISLNLDRPDPSRSFLTRVFQGALEGLRQVAVVLGITAASTPVDRAVAKLSKKLTIEPVTLSNIIRIGLTGEDPEKISKVVNTLLEHYIDRHIDVHQVPGNLQFYAEQAQIYLDRLQAAEAELRAFRNKHGITDIGAQKKANTFVIQEIHKAMALIRGQIAESETRLSALKHNIARTGKTRVLTKELRSTSAIIELTKALVPLLVEKERIGMLYPTNSVEYKDAAVQVQEVVRAIERETQKVVRGSEVDLAGTIMGAKALEDEIEAIKANSLYLTDKQSLMRALSRRVGQNDRNYLLYANKVEEARISQAKDSARVANVIVSAWAPVPSIPVFPKKILLGLVAIVVGLLAGLALAFVSHYLDHTVKTPEELARHGQVPVLAALSDVKG